MSTCCFSRERMNEAGMTTEKLLHNIIAFIVFKIISVVSDRFDGDANEHHGRRRFDACTGCGIVQKNQGKSMTRSVR